jgi:hypothetical protein
MTMLKEWQMAWQRPLLVVRHSRRISKMSGDPVSLTFFSLFSRFFSPDGESLSFASLYGPGT